MTASCLTGQPQSFAIEAYRQPTDPHVLSATHVPFTGSPQKHPLDLEKVLLVVDPFSSNTFYYEFRADDIGYAEELSSIVTLEGETANIARIWVKKGSIALRVTPFAVEDTRRR